MARKKTLKKKIFCDVGVLLVLLCIMHFCLGDLPWSYFDILMYSWCLEKLECWHFAVSDLLSYSKDRR